MSLELTNYLLGIMAPILPLIILLTESNLQVSDLL